MLFDITSDLHLDFWIDNAGSKNKQVRQMKEMLEKLIPENQSTILIIAGDIGHYNTQNALFLKLIKERYEHVLWVHGNHDLYMVSKSILKKFKNSSSLRLAEMTSMANDVGAIRLDGSVVDIGGVKFGGAGGWYDTAYAVQEFGLTTEAVRNMWYTVMNDCNFIKENGLNIDFELMALEERLKIKSIINHSDVIITHVPPEWTNIPFKYKNAHSTFWRFDGSEFLDILKENTIWIYGHVHDKIYSKHPSGVIMAANPLGYPMENGYNNISRRVFVTMDTLNPWMY